MVGGMCTFSMALRSPCTGRCDGHRRNLVVPDRLGKIENTDNFTAAALLGTATAGAILTSGIVTNATKVILSSPLRMGFAAKSLDRNVTVLNGATAVRKTASGKRSLLNLPLGYDSSADPLV
jgi:hypothetical protein